jgi:metal-responsive CopG/Arc/MetJ family transcriptional regulator
MAKTRKMTFTLDGDTADRIDRTAARLGMPKSAVVREAVSEYSARAGRMSESERVRILAVFDEVIPRIPQRAASEVAKEISAIRKSRRTGWRDRAMRPDK